MAGAKLERTWKFAGICLLLAMIASSGGCTRRLFRKLVDRDAFALLKEKDQDSRWKINILHVYPDPRARFADWTNWDRPPMPPDDPQTKYLSPNPQRPYHKAGVAYTEGSGYLEILQRFDKETRRVADERKAEEAKRRAERVPAYELELKGDKEEQKKMIGAAGPSPPVIDANTTYELQNELARPVSRKDLLPNQPPPAKARPFVISIDQAVELATINSREYQTQCEILYLTALPVSVERFAFAAQAFAAGTVLRQYAGLETPPPSGPQNNWATNTVGGFTKLFSTGALLAVQFANQTVINLGGMSPLGTISQSTINLDIVQPFLQGGGRAVTLEPLTQAERNLVYGVRDFYRFRQGFYTFIAVGQAAFIVGQSAGVSALPPGTVQPAAAFSPDATRVVTGSAFSSPPQVVPGAGGRLNPISAASANPQGYLTTLLQKAQLVTYVKNVNSLGYFLDLMNVWLVGGIVNPVQVGTVEQQLVNSIELMLNNWNQYRQALDLFKIQLGVSPALPVELDDGPLQPMYDLIYRYEDNSTAFSIAVSKAAKFGEFEEADKVRTRMHQMLSSSPLVRGLPFEKEAPRRWAEWEKLATPAVNTRLSELGAERRVLLDRQADLEAKRQSLSAAEQKRLDTLNLEIDLGRFEAVLRKYEAQPWKTLGNPKLQRDAQAALFGEVHRLFSFLLPVAVKERLAEIRATWPVLPPVNVGETDLLRADDDTALNTVVQVALNNRVDLMNQRAQVVDAWRKLRVAANALLGVFNVEYHLDSTTPPGLDAPFAFSSSRTLHQLVFNWQLPIVRRVERNTYRSTLIAYQQLRRNYMDAQDQIAFAVRFQLRNLRITAYNYHRVQKRQMELAYMVVDQSLQAFAQPVAPTGPAGVAGLVGRPGAGGNQQADPAALTNQLLTAQTRLVGAQNDLYTQWLGFLQNRINLFRDMGLMPLDTRGIWIDDVSYPPDERPDPLRAYPNGGGPYWTPAQQQSNQSEQGTLEELPPAQLLPPMGRPPAPPQPEE